jgi:hypothetical protein
LAWRIAEYWKSLPLLGAAPVCRPKPPAAVPRLEPEAVPEASWLVRRMKGRRSTSGSTLRCRRKRLVSWYASSAKSDSSSCSTVWSRRQASKPSGTTSQELVTTRASTCGRRMSLVSSSSRLSSMFMRERRSVNSHEARSIIARASRELRISCSMVSSSTRLSFGPGRLAAARDGRSPSLVCCTVPVAKDDWSRLVMPCSQTGKERCSVGISSRRRMATAGSATAAARSRAPCSTAWTTPGNPASSRSA